MKRGGLSSIDKDRWREIAAIVWPYSAPMARLFLSHSTKDKDDALKVRDALEKAGHIVFVDSDHDDGIAPSAQWRPALFRGIRVCHAMVFLNSPNSRDSTWCHTELALTLEKSKPVYAVNLSRDVQPHELLTDRQAIRLETDLEGSLTWLGATLRHDFRGRNRPHVAVETANGEEPQPYPGLRSFTADDSGVFFGRDEMIERLLIRIDGSITTTDSDLVVVTGPSGCGKSSLVKAGVLPALASKEGWITVGPFEPGNSPTEGLAGALVQRGNADLAAAAAALKANGLAEYVGSMLAGRPDARRVLIAIDQIEYLGTADETNRVSFLQLLDDALGNVGSKLTLLLMVRQDRLEEVQRFRPFGKRITATIIVPAMDREDLALAIEEPARQFGLIVDPLLTNALIEDATDHGREDSSRALPLVAVTLQQIYALAKHDDSESMTLAHHEAVGGVAGSIRRFSEQADAVLAGEGPALDALLVRFVRVDDSGKAIARPVLLDDLDPGEKALVSRLQGVRVMTADTTSVRLVHDRLIEAWPRLAEAVDRRREEIQFRSRLDSRAAAWDRNGRRAEFLLGSETTAQADQMLKSDAGFDPVVKEYVSASGRSHARRRRVRTAIASTLTFLTIAALVSAGIAKHGTDVANDQKNKANRLRLASASDSQLESNLGAALLLSLEGSRQHPSDPVTNKSMLAAIDQARRSGLQQLIRTNHGFVDGVAFGGAKGETMAAATSDGTIVLWDMRSGSPVLLAESLDAKHGQLLSIAFDRAGRVFVGANDGTILTWDGRSGTAPTPLDVPAKGGVRSLAFSPDGSTLAAGTAWGHLQLWSQRGELWIGSIELANVAVNGVAFSAEGSTVAATSDDGKVQLVRLRQSEGDTEAPQEDDVVLLAQKGRPFTSVAVSSRGILAAGTQDGDILLWDTMTPSPTPVGTPIRGGNGTVSSVAFSPDDNVLAAATESGDVAVWDMRSEEPILIDEPLPGNSGPLSSVAFSPDGRTLGAGTASGSVLVWEMPTNPPRAIGRPLDGRGGQISSVAFDPGSNLVAAGTQRGGVRLWDRSSGRVRSISRVEGAEDVWINSVAISTDGLLAAGTQQGQVLLWDARNGQPVSDPLNDDVRSSQAIYSVAFSKDGNTLAAGTDGGNERSSVLLWDVKTRRPKPSLAVGTYVHGVAFSPDGHTLAAVDSTDRVWVWDLGSTTPRPRFLDAPGEGTSITFTADGRTLAVGTGSGHVLLWDMSAANPRRLGRLDGRNGKILSVAFSKDDRFVAAGSEKGNLLFWDVATREPVGLIRVGSKVFSVAFAKDGHTIGVGMSAGTVELMPVLWTGHRDLATRVCGLVTGNLTGLEWTTFAPGIRHQPSCPESRHSGAERTAT